METIIDFVDRLKKDIPCYYHRRERGFSLTKCDTKSRQEMRLFAVANEEKDKFRIHAKGWLADNECGKLGDPKRHWSHGPDSNGEYLPGLSFYVYKLGQNGKRQNYNNNGQEYNYDDVVRCLKVIHKNIGC